MPLLWPFKIAISPAFENSDYLKQSIDLGVYGYVFKPVDSAKFTKFLPRLIGISICTNNECYALWP